MTISDTPAATGTEQTLHKLLLKNTDKLFRLLWRWLEQNFLEHFLKNLEVLTQFLLAKLRSALSTDMHLGAVKSPSRIAGYRKDTSE